MLSISLETLLGKNTRVLPIDQKHQVVSLLNPLKIIPSLPVPLKD